MRLGHGHKPEEEPKAKAAAPPEEDAMEVDEVCPGVNTNAEELGDEEAVEDEEAVMVVPLVLVVLPLRLLFLLSGLIVNVIQAVLFLSIRPFSKNLYQQNNRFLAELLWLQLV